MRRGLSSSLVFVVLAAVVALVATLVAGNRPLLGLDLQGGLAVVLQPTTETDDESLGQAIEVIRNRVDAIGVAEPEITQQGDSIVVQLPGVDDSERALELVGQTAELRFRPVLFTVPNTPEGAAEAQAISESFAAFDPEAIGDLTEPDITVDPEAPADTAPAETEAPAVDENGAGPTDTAQVASVEVLASATTTEAPAETEAPASTVAPADDTETTTTEPAPTTTLAPVDPATVITPPEDDIAAENVILPGRDGNFLYVLEAAGATGTIVDDAQAALSQSFNGNWEVSLNFTGPGSIEFDALASANVGRQVAIALDGVVYSAPTIQTANFGGVAQITGNFDEEEAKDLALVLRFGALPVELEPATVQTVSATLGSDALRAGVIAGIVGLLLVAAFITAYYRWAGLVAIGGLAVSGALLWSFISLLGSTSGLALTLAGATGIIVSIGVQVDSNIVYYERLKEEVRRGRSLRVAADQGFRGAFSTIVKADVGSLIGAALLYWLTVGPVRGFAFFLGIATILDLIVSYFYMRPALVLLARRFSGHPNRVIGVPDDQVATPAAAAAAAAAAGGES